MNFGLGTKNPAKIHALKMALKTMPAFGTEKLIIMNTGTTTTVPEMPLTQQQLMQGALERALFTYNTFEDLEYAIGMEGGVFRIKNPTSVFLQSWVYIFNGDVGYYGASPAIPLPEIIQSALYDQDRELGEVIDTLSGKKDVRSNEGTFGILTNNLITRSQAFKWATVAAMAPFFCDLYKTKG